MNEFNLPCTDCGTALIESTVPVDVLPVHSPDIGTVTLGICPDCGARYYPDDVLERIHRTTANTSPHQ